MQEHIGSHVVLKDCLCLGGGLSRQSLIELLQLFQREVLTQSVQILHPSNHHSLITGEVIMTLHMVEVILHVSLQN